MQGGTGPISRKPLFGKEAGEKREGRELEGVGDPGRKGLTLSLEEAIPARIEKKPKTA